MKYQVRKISNPETNQDTEIYNKSNGERAGQLLHYRVTAYWHLTDIPTAKDKQARATNTHFAPSCIPLSEVVPLW